MKTIEEIEKVLVDNEIQYTEISEGVFVINTKPIMSHRGTVPKDEGGTVPISKK